MKFYETPELSVLFMENEDILTVSNGGEGDVLLEITLGEH